MARVRAGRLWETPLGAVNFSLDERLVSVLQSGLPIRTFVETGTFRGDTLARMVRLFDALHSVELSTSLWSEARDRFCHEAKIEVVNGDSPIFLAELRPSLTTVPTLYWLDAHWCAADGVAGETSQCPLLSELRAIGALTESSVILIDDARLFLAPPAAPHEISQWPRFHEIVTALLSLSGRHELMVVNDVIAFFPAQARPLMESYAQAVGVDWVAAAGRVHDLLENEAELREKEGVIQDLARSLSEKEGLIQDLAHSSSEKEREIQKMADSLVEKERVIQEMATALSASETSSFGPIRRKQRS